MKSFKLLTCCIVLLTTKMYSQILNTNNMENSIKKVIVDFQKAIAKRDVKSLDIILHPSFRVMANRYKGSEQTVLIDKKAYLTMMGDQKIGGVYYDLKLIDLVIAEHTAMVEANFISDKSANMHLFLLLVQNAKNKWEIISDLPVIDGNN